MKYATLLLVAAMTTAPTCGPFTWKNFSGTHVVSPPYMATPQSAAELVEFVGAATQNAKRIRMTGSGHSHSDVALSQDAMLTPTSLTDPLTLDRRRLKDPNVKQLVR